ncbi:MAG TPA: acyl-CoA dehydrogenase [Streptosporangiaceae bacterium]|jgi:alkylation response protein AidB-like acyl-CoA dehydrogenase|nr:acyl-CoA dehydrogenase [Streptosporangiaceae bacterium]
MALALTEEHLALAESVRGWAGRAAPAEVIKATVAAGDGGAALYADTLRPALAVQGLLGLHLPESLGGQGYGLPELAIAAEELGRALVPGAFLPTALASAILHRADDDALNGLVKDMAGGTLTGAVGFALGIVATRAPGGGEPGGGEPGGGEPGALVIHGDCGPVAGASEADLVIVPALLDDEPFWVVLDAADVEITPLEGLDLARPAGRVRADHLTVPSGRVLGGLRPRVVTSLAAALLAAEACGIADWAVSTASAYAKIRHQFGRPIGQFQGVKHRCAWMLTAAEQAAATAWDAARALQDAARLDGAGGDGDTDGSADEGEFAAAVAALVAVDAAVSCTHDCIQVLGGIGYTWEHDAHLYYRRALSLRALLGAPGEWAQRVAGLALTGVHRSAGIDLPSEAEPLRARVRADLTAIAAADTADRNRRLAEGGWVVPHLPRPWGRDAGPLEQLVIAEEMRAARLRAPGLAIGAWVIPALVQYGTPQQQERFLPPTLRGELVWCQLFSEPGAGSDLAGLSTRTERAGGGWRLTGQKIWTSLAKQAAWAICVARTDPDAPRHDGISYFLVDMTSPGVQVRPLREMTGDELFNEVFLDDVFVPDDLVVGGVNRGWRVARTTLANERVSLSQSWTFGCGVPELVEAVRAMGDAAGPAELERAGRLVAEGHAIDLLGTRVMLKQLSGTEPGATGSVRKLLGMRYAQRVAEECWSLAGADGALGGTRWSRAVLFTRALTIGGGTTDIQLNIIGERILGLPRDPAPGT